MTTRMLDPGRSSISDIAQPNGAREGGEDARTGWWVRTRFREEFKGPCGAVTSGVDLGRGGRGVALADGDPVRGDGVDPREYLGGQAQLRRGQVLLEALGAPGAGDGDDVVALGRTGSPRCRGAAPAGPAGSGPTSSPRPGPAAPPRNLSCRPPHDCPRSGPAPSRSPRQETGSCRLSSADNKRVRSRHRRGRPTQSEVSAQGVSC